MLVLVEGLMVLEEDQFHQHNTDCLEPALVGNPFAPN